MNRLLLAAVSAITILAGPALAQEQTDLDPAFDAKVRAWVERNGGVILDSVQNFATTKQQAEQAAADGKLVAMVPRLTAADGSHVLGNPEGKIEMIYVLDAQCGYCHRMSPVIDEILAKNPDVKMVQRWVPFLGPESGYAGMMASILDEEAPEAYPAFYKALMTSTGKLDDATTNAMVRAVAGDKADAIIGKASSGPARDAGTAAMKLNMDLAAEGTIQGTPFFMVLNAGPAGIMRGAVEGAQMQAAIDAARNAG